MREGALVMEFLGIRLLVNNFPAMLQFWRDVMKLPVKFSDDNMRYAYFETEKGGLELFSRDAFAAAIGEKMPAPAGRQSVLLFKVDNVDTAYADLVKRGAKSVSAPKDWTEVPVRTAHVADPDGNIVEIYKMRS